MSAIKFWLWLSLKASISEALTAALVDELGSPETVFYADREELSGRFQLSERQLTDLGDKRFDRAERVLELCEDNNVRLLCMQDASYPERLRALRQPPAVLYYRGHLPAMDEEATIGIVGTREPSAYGESVAQRLGYHLAKSGMLVVSGMALGIDGCAHKGALRAGRPTIAVLGTGPDSIYPAEHRDMYEDIIATGAVLSEYPPGTTADRSHFPRRNRIISGLSLGVVIVEAPAGSGALITANHALEQDRDVFAVPGSIDSGNSAGCHRLIREGAALVSRPEDILHEYRALYAHKLTSPPPDTPYTPRPAPPLSLPERNRGINGKVQGGKVYVKKVQAAKAETLTDREALAESEQKPRVTDLSARLAAYPPLRQMILYTIAAEPRIADDIIRLTGQEPESILGELSLLELEGVIRKSPGGRFIMTENL